MPFPLWFVYLSYIPEIVAMERIRRLEEFHAKDPARLHKQLQHISGGVIDKSTSEANLRMLAAGGFGNAIRVVEKKD